MKYRFLAIDVDGTLLGPDHKLAPETGRAIASARAKGLRVCLATGRSYAETIDIWNQVPWSDPYEPMVLIGGALVSEPDTGRTLYRRTIPHDLACEYADTLGEEGYSAMAIVDPWRWGWDYVLCETGDVHAAHRDWLDKMKAEIRTVKRMSDVPETIRPLRITVIAEPPAARRLARKLAEQFDGRLNVHAIEAPNYNVTIVEGFASRTDKWTAIRYVAQGYSISPGEIAAIGDDVNDLAMVRHAGLGAAMPGAVPKLKDAADRVAEGGLGDFIGGLVAGKYD